MDENIGKIGVHFQANRDSNIVSQHLHIADGERWAAEFQGAGAFDQERAGTALQLLGVAFIDVGKERSFKPAGFVAEGDEGHDFFFT